MQTPIIVSIDDDIELYESVAAAEAAIESPEVEAGVVEAWDAARRTLDARIVGTSRRSRWSIDILPVVLLPSETATPVERPARLLREGLALAGHPVAGPAVLTRSSNRGFSMSA